MTVLVIKIMPKSIYKGPATANFCPSYREAVLFRNGRVKIWDLKVSFIEYSVLCYVASTVIG